MKDNVNILVVGDEGVGKSSFISAYISQHFPQEVPSVMSDVILPPEAVANETRVKIMDSSAHQNDRAVLKQKIADADSIIALHDVTRPDTFESLSGFWLPLILEMSEDTQMKPVVVVGAKIDLLEEEQPRDIQLNEFLREFPTVMNYWRCSAVNLYDLDKAFTAAEQFVNYPLDKIVDITDPDHAFKPGTVRAFQRIFRIFDVDGDNLLCDAEFMDVELRCFDDVMNSDELMAAKQRVYLADPSSVRDNCLTFEGFLALIKLTLYDHKHQIPWLILRRFKYDDNFNIVVPEAVSRPPELREGQVSELSAPARRFLLQLAHIAYAECERLLRTESDSSSEAEPCITREALRSILSVMSGDDTSGPASPGTPESQDGAEDPWSDPPAYKSFWQYNESVELRILLRGLVHADAVLSFDDWLAHWSLLAVNDPVAAQVLLFKLGYVERDDLGVVPSSGPMQSVLSQAAAASAEPSFIRRLISSRRPEAPTARSVLQVCVLGDDGVGKSSFVWQVTGMRAPGLVGDTDLGVQYAKFSEAILVGGWTEHHQHQHHVSGTQRPPTPQPQSLSGTGSGTNLTHLPIRANVPGGVGSTSDAGAHNKAPLRSVLTDPYQVSVTAVPLAQVEAWLETSVKSCDLVVLMFQCANVKSLSTAIILDAKLPPQVPRIFLASKSDTVPSPQVLSLGAHSPSSQRGEFGNQTRATRESMKAMHEKVLQEAASHLQARGLPPLALLSTLTGDGVVDAQHLIVDVATCPERGLPKDKPKAASGISVTASTVLWATGLVASLGGLSVWLLWTYNPKARDWINEWLANTKKLLLGPQGVLAIAN